MRFMRVSWGKDDPWWSMSQEEQLHTWLKTCPFDYLIINNTVKRTLSQNQIKKHTFIINIYN